MEGLRALFRSPSHRATGGLACGRAPKTRARRSADSRRPGSAVVLTLGDRERLGDVVQRDHGLPEVGGWSTKGLWPLPRGFFLLGAKAPCRRRSLTISLKPRPSSRRSRSRSAAGSGVANGMCATKDFTLVAAS